MNVDRSTALIAQQESTYNPKSASKKEEKKVPNPLTYVKDEVDGVSITLQGISLNDKERKQDPAEGSPLSDPDLLRHVISLIEDPEWKTLLFVSTSFNKAVHSLGAFHRTLSYNVIFKTLSQIDLNSSNKDEITQSFENIAKALSKNGDRSRAKETLLQIKQIIDKTTLVKLQGHDAVAAAIFDNRAQGYFAQIRQNIANKHEFLNNLLKISTTQAAIGDIPEAQKTLSEIEETVLSQNQPEMALVSQLAVAQAQCNDIVAAEKTLSQIPSDYTRAATLRELSKIYNKKGDTTKRDNALSQAEKEGLALQNPPAKYLSLINLIRTRAEMGQIEEIKTAMDRLKDDMDQYVALEELVMLYVKKNQIPEAKEVLQKAKKVIAADTESSENLKQSRRCKIAEIEATIDNKDKVNESLAEIRKNLEKEDDLYEKYHTLKSIATIQDQIGAPEAQATIAEAKSQIFLIMKNQSSQPENKKYDIPFFNEIALIQTQRGDVAQAEETFLEAEKIASEISSKESLASIQLNREQGVAKREINQGKISEAKKRIISISAIEHCNIQDKVNTILELVSLIPDYINN